MLSAVRGSFLFASFLIVAAAIVAAAPQSTLSSQAAPPPTAQGGLPQSAPSQPVYSGPVIVLNPAHGGTDTGARGENGAIEKDIVLQFARAIRIELVRQGYRVVMTRDDDSDPSYDDRAEMANSYRDAIFISLHVSSTGMPSIARAYYYRFWNPIPPVNSPVAATGATAQPIIRATPSATLTPWNEAQRPHEEESHRLADQIQLQLAQSFAGSPAVSQGVAVRGLRSVAAPAVAIEISSVSVNAASLTAMAEPLAACILKGLEAFRAPNSAGAK